eukprot:521836-Prymnesium_polylepis.1
MRKASLVIKLAHEHEHTHTHARRRGPGHSSVVLSGSRAGSPRPHRRCAAAWYQGYRPLTPSLCKSGYTKEA